MTKRQRRQQLIAIVDSCDELGGVSRTTIYDLVNRGELVKVNIGRRGFITAESLDAYVDRLSQAATAIRRLADRTAVGKLVVTL